MTTPASSLQPPASRLKIAFFGTPQFSVPILNSIYQEFEVILVVSQPDRPVGKGLQLTPSPISEFALNHQLPLLRPQKLTQVTFQASLAEAIDSGFSILDSRGQNVSDSPLQNPESRIQNPNHNIDLPEIDIAVVAAYGHILPQWLLDWPRLGCLNIHTSLLPKYRGSSPITAALLNGDQQTGITFMRMDAKMDQGPIISQIPVDIDSHETSDSLFIKLSQTASNHINQVLIDYSKKPTQLSPQDHSQATYTTQLSKQDGYLDLSNLPNNWQSRIYAYHSWPGAWTIFQDQRLKLLPHSQVQPAGKKPTPLKTYLNVHPDFPLTEGW